MSAVRFFFKHAGWSYTPGKETKLQGRWRCARALAAAEAEAREQQLDYEWFVDETTDSSDFSDEKPAWALWVCICRDSERKVVASLSGIDFGRDGLPWGEPYKRVVEAELASEVAQ